MFFQWDLHGRQVDPADTWMQFWHSTWSISFNMLAWCSFHSSYFMEEIQKWFIAAWNTEQELSCGKAAWIIWVLNLTKLNAQIATTQKSCWHQSQKVRPLLWEKVHLGTAKVNVGTLSLGLSSKVVCEISGLGVERAKGGFEPTLWGKLQA